MLHWKAIYNDASAHAYIARLDLAGMTLTKRACPNLQGGSMLECDIL